jgi:hypothetical protein
MQGHNAAERFRQIEKSNNLIGIQTRDLSACSLASRPITLPFVPKHTFLTK